MEEKLFYLGSLDVESFAEEDGMLIKKAELFSVGKHRGVDYTEDDLIVLKNNFSAADEVPIQWDHSESAKDTIGFLKSVGVKDGKLMGEVALADETAIDRVKKGLNKKLSISFYLHETEEGIKPFKLREVSLVAFPQVKSARLFSEGNNYVSTYTEPENNKEGEEQMEKVDLKELRDQLKAEIEDEIKTQYSEMETELKQLRDLKINFTEKQITDKVEKFAEAGKIVPAQKECLTALMKSFTEEQMTEFEKFMESQAKVDFQEQGEFEQENGEQQDDEKTEFDKFYEEHVNKFGKSL